MQFSRAIACLGLSILLTPCLLVAYFMKDSYDPWPVYNTAESHQFLNVRYKDIAKGWEVFRDPEHVSIAVTAFGQGARHAKNASKKVCTIGDIHGPWNMLALLFTEDCIPSSGSLYDAYTTGRYYQQNEDDEPIDGPLWSLGADEFQEQLFDKNIGSGFGKVSVGLDYRKYGVRGECSLLLTDYIGIMIQAGVSDIQVTATTFEDLSTTGFICEPVDICDDTTSTVTQRENVATVRSLLTNEETIKQIGRELGLDMCNFHDVGLEDVKVTAFWRKTYDMSEINYQWPNVLLTPFMSMYGVIALGKDKKESQPFSMSHGNNGHHAGGFNAGFSLDFHDTIEVIAQVGGTWFSERTVRNMYLPDNRQETGIFKCKADVTVKPGANWYGDITLHARHFIDHLSFYCQYCIVTHAHDDICLLDTSSTLLPSMLTCESSWWSRFLNLGLNYDITPSLSAGLLWQAPLDRRNAYRTTTIAATIRGMI